MRHVARFIATAILGLALSALGGCGLGVDEAARFERARQAYVAGDMSAAVVDLKALLQRNPEHVEARLLLAEALFRTRDVAGATKELERGVELLRRAGQSGDEGSPPDLDRRLVEAASKLAALQLAQREFAKARESADIALAHDSSAAAAYLIASQAAFYANDNAGARSYAERLLRIGTADPWALAMLGFVDAREGAYDAAEGHFMAVLERQPNQGAIRLALTQLQVAMGKPAAAAGTLAPVLVAAPTDGRLHQLLDIMQLGTPEARSEVSRIASQMEAQNATSPVPSMLRGRAALLARDYPAAAEEFAAARAKQGGRYPLIGYYVAQRLLGDQATAHQALEEWVSANPDDQAAGFLLASAYLDRGQSDRARAEYERLVGSNEIDSPLALNNLAWLYGEVDDPRAIETARRARQLAPENGAITDTLGWLLVQAGQHDEGIRLLRLAVQQAPESEEIRAHLTAALAQVGERDEVQLQIERILPSALDSGGGSGAGGREAPR